MWFTLRSLSAALARVRLGGLLTLLALLATACGGGAQGAVVAVEPQAGGDDGAPVFDMSTLNEKSVVPYVLGPSGPMAGEDLQAMKSAGEAYTEKWEMYLYGRPWEVKLRMQVANLGFGDFKGRVSGHVKQFDGDEVVAEYPIKASFSEDQWTSSKDGFALEFGKWRIAGEPGDYTVTGVAGKDDEVSFDFQVVGEPWRPGTGMVVFGQDAALYVKTQTMLAQGKTTGTVELDGQSYSSEGRVYGNHFATNVAAHELADRIYHFRKQDDDIFVEWRTYVPSATYDQSPFGYVVVSYQGEILFESHDLQISPLEYWVDPNYYNYSIERGMTVQATDGEDKLQLRFTVDDIDARDPLESLPALERSVAAKFAQPMEYTLNGQWRLDLLVDGMAATLQEDGSYSTTAFR